MVPKLIGLSVAFPVLFLILGFLEWLWPAVRGKRWWRSESGTDLGYWFFTPLVSKTATKIAIGLTLLPLALLSGIRPTKESIVAALSHARGPMTGVPDGIQILLVLLLGDLMSYGMHRLFHRKPLWAFHAVHHQSRTLDWLSAVRLHPVNEVLTRVAQIVPFYLLGFKATILAAYAPFLTFYAILIHANVPWTYGPLRYVIASPTFHRWHHTSDAEGLDKNFAGFFPFIDVMFGTFYMPVGQQPQVFGLSGEDSPRGIVRQLVTPFAELLPSPREASTLPV